MTNRIPLFLIWLICAILVVGPLYVGSYFDEFRYPLLCTSWLIAILASLKPNLYLKAPKLLSLSALTLTGIGLWMMWNSVGIFYDTWWLDPRPDQPCPALPGAADFDLAWDKLAYIIPCLCIAILTCQLTRSTPHFFKYVCMSIYGTGAAIALIGIHQELFDVEHILGLYTPSRNLFFGTFRSPGIACCYLNIAFALALGNFLIYPKEELSVRRVLSKFIGCSILFLGIILSSSKTGIALTVLTLILWFFLNLKTIRRLYADSTHSIFRGKKIERNLALALSLLLIGAFTFILSDKLITRVAWSIKSDAYTWTSRMQSFAVQWEMITNKDWLPLGHGPGSFMPYFFYYAMGHPNPPAGHWVYAHNDYLQTTIEWGPIGLIGFFLIIAPSLWLLFRAQSSWKKQYSHSHAIMVRSCLIGMIAMLLHATLDFPFQIESIAITFFVLVGIGWSHKPQKETP